MAKTNNIIELNGKRYDAVTGAFLGMQAQQAGVPKVIKPATPSRASHRGGTVMDSVVVKPTKATEHKAPKVQHVAVAKPPVHRQHKPKTIAPHQPEHTKTLMRHVVKPPTTKPKPAVKLQAPTDLVKKQPAVLAVAPKLSSQVVDPQRSARAGTVAKSTKVARFRQAPQPRQFGQHGAQPVRAVRPRSTEGMAPIKPLARTARPNQAPARAAASKQNEDVFERALARAQSHEQAPPKIQTAKQRKHKRTRLAGITASLLVVVALGGFIAYQNRAHMQLELASSRSGVHASLPSYKPSGFAFHGVSYSPGTVTVGFNSADKSFNITQKASNWNSETLLENVVATSGASYQAYQSAGRTIYVYDNGGATWVNGGVWYQISGNAHLGKDQLINLATSI